MTHLLFRIILFFYSLVFHFGALFAKLFIAPLPFASSWDIQKRWLGPCPHCSSKDPVIWLHAASLGECKVMIRFLDIIREANSSQRFLVTATTKPGLSYLLGHPAPDIVGAGYLPMDTNGRMKDTLTRFHVKRVWLVETELWPSMIWACKVMGVPIGLVNARIEQQSFSAYKRLGAILKPLLTYADIVLAQNETYALRFAQLQIPQKNIHVTGNIKSYVTIRQCPDDERAALRSALLLGRDDICITFGCVHEGEAEIIKKAIDILIQSGCRVKGIIVPRHLRESAAIARQCGSGALVLDDIKTNFPWDICIISKIGILDTMYKISDAAFVGGTFDKTGAHNMWDAAQFGIPVFFGPDTHTQQESAKTLITAGVGFKVTSAKDLAEQILFVLQNGNSRFLLNKEIFMKTTNAKSNTIKELIP